MGPPICPPKPHWSNCDCHRGLFDWCPSTRVRAHWADRKRRGRNIVPIAQCCHTQCRRTIDTRGHSPGERSPADSLQDGQQLDESNETPIETLRRRYAEGELDQEEFERRLDQLIETEEPEQQTTERERVLE
ncbi:SHOCT domain-containing protein [Haloarcula japonica]|uniref:SHOCT domain-containing protein n=1 Tax=Haloarcula japonica TaxID=29282 RepID=UPI0039F64AD5